jgi:hypothetical protein
MNGFRFGSDQFEMSCPRVATRNTGVVTRTLDAHDRKTNYYGIIQNILEFNFAGNKTLKVVFFLCVGVSRPGGPSGRRVSVAACPSPDGSSAWASAKGGRSEAAGDRRERGGNPVAFVFVPRPGRVRLQ